jgi:hypothetical protein
MSKVITEEYFKQRAEPELFDVGASCKCPLLMLLPCVRISRVGSSVPLNHKPSC